MLAEQDMSKHSIQSDLSHKYVKRSEGCLHVHKGNKIQIPNEKVPLCYLQIWNHILKKYFESKHRSGAHEY